MQSNSHNVEKELLFLTIRRLIVNADDFFLTQQRLLKNSYEELSTRVDQLRTTVQHGRTIMPGSSLEATHPSAVGSASPFSMKVQSEVPGLMGTPALNVTPLRNGGPFGPGPSRATPGMMTGNGSVSGTIFDDAAHPNETSTPPHKHLFLSAIAERTSPSMTLDDRLGGDWSTITVGKHHQPDASSLMASPQTTERLSLDDLMARVMDHSVNSLYQELTGKDSDTPRRPSDGQRSHALASAAPALPFDGGCSTTQHHIDPLSCFRKNDVIPIDTFRNLQTQHQHLTTSVRAVYAGGRPKVVPIPGNLPDSPSSLGIDQESNCQVLVEFKRKRVLQYDSNRYVAPGSYVMVGGDRGEDLGLVIYTWTEAKPSTCDGASSLRTPLHKGNTNKSNTDNATRGTSNNSLDNSKSNVVGIGLTGSALTRSIGVGSGTVLRLATEEDVEQMHTTQVELECRAIDVCAQRVLDHALPMVIVDAEYQFDKNKLTFFYEAQQRMDFRVLVRDLFKTFHARIWMELVDI